MIVYFNYKKPLFWMATETGDVELTDREEDSISPAMLGPITAVKGAFGFQEENAPILDKLRELDAIDELGTVSYAALKAYAAQRLACKTKLLVLER